MTLGENLEEFVEKNHRDRTNKARAYLARLRKLSNNGTVRNPDEYLDILEQLLELTNKTDDVNKISFLEIGTTEKEILGFEAKASSLLEV